MQWALYLIAFAAGLALTVQVGLNATLRSSLGQPALAALVNFLVGLFGLASFLLLSRAGLPSRAALVNVPLWAWTGGILGAFYVVMSTVLGPRLGAAALLALTVLGQLLASLVIDHYGWLGFPQHPISLLRVAGAVLLFGGVLMIVR